MTSLRGRLTSSSAPGQSDQTLSNHQLILAGSTPHCPSANIRNVANKMVPTIYKRLIQIGKISGAISFLFAAPYALIQYWQAQKNARIEQTLNMYKLYNAGPFTDYRGKITKALVKNRDKLNQAAVNEISLTAAQTDVVRKENIEMELLLVMDFFDGLAVCVKGQVCDDETAIKLFKPRAYDVYLN